MTKVHRIILAAGVCATVAFGAAWWHFNPAGKRAFVLECEAILAKRLVAPATYQRISVTGLQRAEADFNDFMGTETQEKVAMRAKSEAEDKWIAEMYYGKKKEFRIGKFERAFVQIQYDAANGFGAPIRDVATCQQVVKKGASINPRSPLETAVNGYSALDWSLYLLWKADHPD